MSEEGIPVAWINNYLKRLEELEQFLMHKGQREMAVTQKLRREFVKDMMETWREEPQVVRRPLPL